MARKVNVEVDVHFDTDGTMLPTAIKWEDGRVFEVDKVLDVRQAASLKAGGQGCGIFAGFLESKRICGLKIRRGLWKANNKRSDLRVWKISVFHGRKPGYTRHCCETGAELWSDRNENR